MKDVKFTFDATGDLFDVGTVVNQLFASIGGLDLTAVNNFLSSIGLPPITLASIFSLTHVGVFNMSAVGLAHGSMPVLHLDAVVLGNHLSLDLRLPDMSKLFDTFANVTSSLGLGGHVPSCIIDSHCNIFQPHCDHTQSPWVCVNTCPSGTNLHAGAGCYFLNQTLPLPNGAEMYIDRVGNDVFFIPTPISASDIVSCAQICAAREDCYAYTYDICAGNCWVKGPPGGNRTPSNCSAAGIIGWNYEQGVSYSDAVNLASMPVYASTVTSCAAKCYNAAGCVSFRFDSCGSLCYLQSSKGTVQATTQSTCSITGMRYSAR